MKGKQHFAHVADASQGLHCSQLCHLSHGRKPVFAVKGTVSAVETLAAHSQNELAAAAATHRRIDAVIENRSNAVALVAFASGNQRINRKAVVFHSFAHVASEIHVSRIGGREQLVQQKSCAPLQSG